MTTTGVSGIGNNGTGVLSTSRANFGDNPFLQLLTEQLRNILASRYSLGTTQVERPVPAAGRGGLVCAHCGFSSGHERAFYCPKCGMRLLRG